MGCGGSKQAAPKKKPAARSPTPPQKGYTFDVELTCTFAEAIQKVTAALKPHGFGVLTTIDVQKAMKDKIDEDMPPYTILGSCNPQFAFKALQMEPLIGDMLPCNIVVRELPNGNVAVSATDPAVRMLGIRNAELEGFAMEVREAMYATTRAVKNGGDSVGKAPSVKSRRAPISADKVPYTFDAEVEGTHADVIDKVKAALKEIGFGVLTEIDMQKTMKAKINKGMPAYTILGACNPKFAFRAIQVEALIGSMLPCNVVVRDLPNGKVGVHVVDPAASMAGVENPKLAEVAAEVRPKLQALCEGLR